MNHKKFHQYNARDLQHALYGMVTRDEIDNIIYILEDDTLKNRVNIHADNDMLLYMALVNNKLSLIEYLLTSPTLDKHADITYVRGSHGLLFAANNGDLPVMQWLMTSDSVSKKLTDEEKRRLLTIVIGKKNITMLNYLLLSEDVPLIWNLDNIRQELENLYLTAGCLDYYMLIQQKYPGYSLTHLVDEIPIHV